MQNKGRELSGEGSFFVLGKIFKKSFDIGIYL